MRRTVYVLLATLAVVRDGRATEFPLEEYERNAAGYLAGLANLSVRITDSDATRDGATTVRTEITVQSRPGHFRARQVRRTSREGGTQTTIRHVLLRPDGYFCVLERAPGEFVLELHQPEVKTLGAVGGDSPLQPLAAPVCRLLRPLPALLRGQVPGFQVKVIGYNPRPGGAEVVTHDVVNGNEAEGRYELDTNGLIRSSRIRSVSGHREVEQRIEYTTFRGATLPARVVSRSAGGDQKSAAPGVTTYEDYAAFEGTRADFSLKQFGLPEVVGYDAPGAGPRTWLYLSGAALMFIGIWAWFARRTRRGAAATPD